MSHDGLIVKLGATGDIQWQKGYSGGVYCYFNGFSEVCVNVAPFIYSLRPAADGGYLLAGDSDLELTDSAPIEPWLAEVDANGTLSWQRFYYRTNPTSHRPIAGYAPAATASPGGVFALGDTETVDGVRQLLYGIQTDASGVVSGCSEVHPATSLNLVDPALISAASTLPVASTIMQSSAAPVTSAAAPLSVTRDC